MNYLIDTHSHIYAEEFDADRDEAIRRAREAGVERLLLPAIDSESHGRLFDTVRRYPDHCTPMMGLHPTSINDNPRWREELALVERNEAPLGIVYGSDAVVSKGVKVVATFPEDSHKKVEYPVAVVEGHNNATVKAFYDYLKGPQAAEIFKRYGFTTK